MGDASMVCPQCGNRWFVPPELAIGPTAQHATKAARQARRGNRFTRKRRRFEAGLTADQAARTAEARRCPRCGAGGQLVTAPDIDAGPGWQPDPWGQAGWRWWDGDQWTGHTK